MEIREALKQSPSNDRLWLALHYCHTYGRQVFSKFISESGYQGVEFLTIETTIRFR